MRVRFEDGEAGSFDGVIEGDSARIVVRRRPSVVVGVKVTQQDSSSASTVEEIVKARLVAHRARRNRRNINVKYTQRFATDRDRRGLDFNDIV